MRKKIMATGRIRKLSMVAQGDTQNTKQKVEQWLGCNGAGNGSWKKRMRLESMEKAEMKQDRNQFMICQAYGCRYGGHGNGKLPCGYVGDAADAIRGLMLNSFSRIVEALEARLADPDYARRVYDHFVDALTDPWRRLGAGWRNVGTSVWCSPS